MVFYLWTTSMLKKIKSLVEKVLESFIKDKKHEMNNTPFKWDNEYSFHPAGQKDKDTL